MTSKRMQQHEDEEMEIDPDDRFDRLLIILYYINYIKKLIYT